MWRAISMVVGVLTLVMVYATFTAADDHFRELDERESDQ